MHKSIGDIIRRGKSEQATHEERQRFLSLFQRPEIEIRDQSILQYHYDGTFRNETIFEVLDVLKLTLPVQYHIEGQKIIINARKEQS